MQTLRPEKALIVALLFVVEVFAVALVVMRGSGPMIIAVSVVSASWRAIYLLCRVAIRRWKRG